MHSETHIASMEAELTEAGFKALKTAKEVTAHFQSQQGTTLLFINSACGCAGVDARLGVKKALATSSHKPDHLVTVFAGVDLEATTEVKAYIKPYPLSSPAIVLFKADTLVYCMERHQLKGVEATVLAETLQVPLVAYCSEV